MNSPIKPAPPLTDLEDEVSRRLLASAASPDTGPVPAATSYRDTSPIPKTGTAPVVPQPEHRLVPQWAAGTAVVLLGGGAGCTGIGCGFWLMFNGASSVTATGVAALLAPFAGVAAVITAIGAVVAHFRATTATTHHHYEGTVHQRNEHTTNSTTRGLLARTINNPTTTDDRHA